ncbi:MAG: Trehalose synthase [Leptospirillum sp. Group IV 'UBA BS']|nr:MAG: Trehalose synthase [Leptospirillum sp. Group IV 'UBA BS']
MLSVRQEARLFGRGRMTLLPTKNRSVLVYLREMGQDVVLVINNLSDRTESVTVDLARFRNCVPVELFDKNPFPPIRNARFHFTLSPYGFFWLELRPPGHSPRLPRRPASSEGYPHRRLGETGEDPVSNAGERSSPDSAGRKPRSRKRASSGRKGSP